MKSLTFFGHCSVIIFINADFIFTIGYYFDKFSAILMVLKNLMKYSCEND